MSRRRIVALAVPVALAVFALGFMVGLEAWRGPDWRLELNEYIAEDRLPAETVAVQKVVKARNPWCFSAAIAAPQVGDWINPLSAPQAVRCVLLVRRRPAAGGGDDDEVRQVVFLVHHSDALYRVGWLAYEGPEEPFKPEFVARLEAIGCDLGLD